MCTISQFGKWFSTNVAVDTAGFAKVCYGVTMMINETTMYTIFCPALDERETAASMHEANDIAFDMHTDSGEYVWCEDYLGHTVVEYGEA